MAIKCALHPGRDSAGTVYGKHYCQKCLDSMAAARRNIDKHVVPKDCFITYFSNGAWKPIDGTGCAHWVSHQKGITNGSANDKCLDGYTCRVKVMIQGKLQVTDLKKVQVNDIWVNETSDHTGLVFTVKPAAKPGNDPTITIRHDSSGQGKVADNDWATFFHGKGRFYR
jgi:hypothetical protein